MKFINIRSILSIPSMYRLFSDMIGAKRARTIMVQKYLKTRKGYRVLDIGCGTGDILEYLDGVNYTGFDIDLKYIDAAKKRFGNRGVFLCQSVRKEAMFGPEMFDIVISFGVLHHLTDDEAINLFQLASSALKPGCRIITVDPCYVKCQSAAARFLISIDRGRYVRSDAEYFKLAQVVFRQVNATIEHDLLRIPYSHIILECVNE